MAACLNQIILLLSLGLMIMIVAATNVCDFCNCFEYEEDTYVISCKSHKKHILKFEFDSIEWPPNRANIKAFFNQFPVNLLPKFVSKKKILDKASVFYDMLSMSYHSLLCIFAEFRVIQMQFQLILTTTTLGRLRLILSSISRTWKR